MFEDTFPQVDFTGMLGPDAMICVKFADPVAGPARRHLGPNSYDARPRYHVGYNKENAVN